MRILIVYSLMWNKHCAKILLILLLVLVPGSSLLTAGEPAHRIHGDLRGSRAIVLEHSVSPYTAAGADMGELNPASQLPRLAIHFDLSAAQQSDLTALLKRQSDPSSRDYHKWLTPEQFAGRYGLSDSDLQKISEWLLSNNLAIIETARSKTWIAFTGSAADVQNAFGTSLHRYAIAGVEHFANQSPVNLPAALNGIVSSVRGLNDFHPRPHNTLSRNSNLRPHFTSSITGNHFLAPADFATIYDVNALYNNGINGTGQKIAVAGQTDVDLTDIRTFRQVSGLSPNDPQIVLTGKDPGTVSADVGEADLDLEWAGAVAPQATIIFVNSADAFTSAIYAIDNNLAPVLSISYGSCEAEYASSDLNSLAAAFQQGNAQGITTVTATGDTGAADCDSPTTPTGSAPSSASKGPSVDVPSSIPYVTSMGGTSLQEGTATYWSSTNSSSNGSALSYIPEVAWNDTAVNGFLAASGGGKSTFFPKPTWQLGTGVPNDGARDTPDLSLAASPDHDGYLTCSAGSCVNGFRDASSNLNVVGGVSIAAPTFAGIVALLNQQTNTSHGNINPGLYSLASISTNAFHDITVGDNIVPCTAGSTGCPASGSFGFAAGVGYDQVSGLGTVDAYNLVTQWGSDFSVTASPATLTINPGSAGTTTVQVAKLANFGGTVSFTCTVAAPLTNTTCSVPGTVSGSGTATLSISNSSPAFLTPHFRVPRLTGRAPGLLAAFLAMLLSWTFLSREHRSRFLLGGATIAMALILTSCDDGSSSSTSTSVTQTQTPSVTGNVIVTATSGIEVHTATVAVTVS